MCTVCPPSARGIRGGVAFEYDVEYWYWFTDTNEDGWEEKIAKDLREKGQIHGIKSESVEREIDSLISFFKELERRDKELGICRNSNIEK